VAEAAAEDGVHCPLLYEEAAADGVAYEDAGPTELEAVHVPDGDAEATQDEPDADAYAEAEAG